MYDDEHLPFDVYLLRYPLIRACYHVQQHTDELITHLVAMCTVCNTGRASPLERRELHEDIVSALADVLESGKQIPFEITSLFMPDPFS